MCPVAWGSMLGVHGIMETVCEILRHFHRLELLETCFLGNFVLALVCIVLKVPHVCNVPHIPHLVADVLQITEHHVEGYCGTRVAEMGVAVNSGAADIHSDPSRGYRYKFLLGACARVVDQKFLGHGLLSVVGGSETALLRIRSFAVGVCCMCCCIRQPWFPTSDAAVCIRKVTKILLRSTTTARISPGKRHCAQ